MVGKRPQAAITVRTNDDDTRLSSGSPPAKRTCLSSAPRLGPQALETNDDKEGIVGLKEGDPATSAHRLVNVSDLIVPVDEHCPEPGLQVYIDSEDSVIYDASLNQTSSGKNANKFYRMQLLMDPAAKKFMTWTRWGRVGVVGQSATLGSGNLDSAMGAFRKKFKDKSGLDWFHRNNQAVPGKYVFLEKSYDLESDPEQSHDDHATQSTSKESCHSHKAVPCNLQAPVRSVVELIFNEQYMDTTMVEMNYDAKKQPLGKLSETCISKGFHVLKELSEILSDPALAHTASRPDIIRLSDLYYSYIPHNFGFKKPPVISTIHALKQEVQLLDSLTDLKETSKLLELQLQTKDTVHQLDSLFRGLGLEEMTPLESSSAEYKLIDEYLHRTSSADHSISYRVQDIFRIKREGDFARFRAQPAAESDRRLLWHGSRTTNYGGILSQGLRIAPPEAPCSGYMFGKGIYLADMSSKSANYCCTYISGGKGLLLLCEAELGKPMQAFTDAKYTAAEDAKASGTLATWGQGRLAPAAWKSASCLHSDLEGVIMVRDHATCHMQLSADFQCSRIPNKSPSRPRLKTHVLPSTNTSYTTSRRCGFATSSTPRCRLALPTRSRG